MIIKVIEGTIAVKEIEVLTAEKNRAIAEYERNRYKRELEEKERKNLNDLANRCKILFPIVITAMIEDINLRATQGHNTTETKLWDTDNSTAPYGMNWKEYCFMKKDIEEFLNSLGYKLVNHNYAQMWVTRTGHLGYMWVSW